MVQGIRQRQPRKHVALELGNSTPVIVEPDADLEVAAQKLAASGYTHAGQSCISVQRVYVHEAAFDRFRDLFVGAAEGLVVGDPVDDATDVGPVIDEESRERVLEWIGEARQAGAEVLAGGGLNEDGLIAPTVIEGIDPEMKVSCEEVFGPVVGLASYASIDEAVDLANSSPFGLQAGIFTARTDAAMAWARRLHFGGVVTNETPTFRADQMPYGGVKDSGNTREEPRLRSAQHERAEARAAEHPAGLAAGDGGARTRRPPAASSRAESAARPDARVVERGRHQGVVALRREVPDRIRRVLEQRPVGQPEGRAAGYQPPALRGVGSVQRGGRRGELAHLAHASGHRQDQE